MADSVRAGRVREITGRYAAWRGPLLPALHAVHAEFGALQRDDIVVIADVLNVSIADVHGVVSFYHDFRTSPPPAHTLTVCRGEACQAVGSQELFDSATTEYGHRSDVEVREVFCLGLCALGPSGLVDGRVRSRLTPERFSALTSGWGG